MIRWAWAVATTVMVVSGCDCPGPNPPVNCSDTTITFETPTADQTVDAPFDVSIIVKNADGSAFNFERAQLSVSGGEAIEATSVSGNRATFTGVPGTAGAQSLVATIGQSTCSKSSAPHNIIVRDTCSNAQVSAISFPQDTGAPLGTLNRSELPAGTDLQVQVDATCVSGVQVRIKRNGTEVAPLTAFSNGRATISLPGIPATDSEVVEVFAELVRGTTVLNSATGAAVQSIRIARALPSCAITTSGTFGPLDDADATTPGFQMRVSGTMAAGTSGTLTVTGANAVPVVPNGMGDVSADFTLTTSGNYTATLVCSDATGNTNTVTGLFTLDFDAPTVTITAPACGAQLTTFNVTATANVVGADGETLTFSVRPSGMPTATPVAVGSAVVMSGVASAMISLPGNGSYVLIAEVSDAVGNLGRDTEGEANCTGGGPGPIVVNSTQCSLSFTRPQSSPAVVLRPEVTGGNYSLALSSSCPNTAVELTTNGANPVTVNTDGTGVVGFTVPATDGQTFSYRGCVTNTGGNPPTCTTVSVTYRLTQPTIVAPTASSMPLNLSRDSSDTTPGVQTQLAFTAPAGLATFICSNQLPRPNNVADCPNGAAGFWVLAGGSSFSSPVPGFTFPDGTYDVVVVSQAAGGTYDTSTPLAVVADGLAPCVAPGLLVAGDANMDSTLNAAELAGAVSAQFALGCGDTPATISQVRWTSGCGSVAHSQASGVSNTGNNYTVVLQRSTLPTPVEQQFAFGIQLTDVNGNTNTLCGTSPAPNAAALFSLRIDDAVPVCTIASPAAAAVFGLAGDADTSTAGFQLRVAFDTSPDVATGSGAVSITGGTATAGTPTRNGDRITRDYTFAATGTDTVSVGVVCTDGAGNATTATAAAGVVLDRDAPTCTLVNPANNSTSGTFSVATRVDVTGGEGRMVTVRSGTMDVGTLTVTGGQAAGSLSYPSGVQQVTATLTDAAGNACTTPANTLTVNATGCAISVTSPMATITTANSTPVSPGVASIAPSAHSNNCNSGQTVRLYRLLPGPRTLLGSATTNGTGDVTFSTNVNDATTVQYEFEIDNGAGLLTTVQSSSLLVDLSRPTAASTSPALPVIFVVTSSNANVPSDARYFVDAAAGAPADLSFTLTTVAGAAGGSARVRLTTPSQVLGTTAIAGSPVASVVVAAAFPHRLNGVEYVVELVDSNGNVTELHRGLVSTDVIAPASPGVSTSFAVPSDARIGNVQVRIESPTVTPSYDDGTTQASGAHAGYDIRWTTLRQWNDTLGARAGAPCLELNSDYFDSSKAVAEAIVPFNATSVINQPLRVPPANRYCIEVRARDALGNYSPHVVPTVMNNDPREHELTNPTGVASQDFGLVMASNGSLNSDSLDDLVVAGSRRAITSTNVGAVYVYYGSTGFTAQAACTMPACQEIQPYDTAAGGRFGASLAVGDVGGDSAKPDLVIGSPFWSASTGRVFLFFGSATQTSIDTATFIEFRGGQNNTRLGDLVGVLPGRAGQSLLVISAHTSPFSGTTATNQGRVYIYRSRTLAQWQALRTGSFVPVNGTTADWVIDGPLPVSTQSPTPSPGNQFARVRGGLTGLGDINGDSIPDLAISMAKNTTDGNKVFLYAGREAQDAGTTVTSAGTVLSTLSSSTLDMTEVGLLTGLGTRLVGGAIYGAAAPDLLVTKQDLGVAYLYRDGAGGMFGAPDITIQGTESLSFGSWANMGDLNGDTRMDLAIGDGASANSSGWVFFQHGNNRFDSVAGGGFWQARLQGTNAKGICTAIGDFDGDLVQDLAMGDSSGSFGRVFVWH